MAQLGNVILLVLAVFVAAIFIPSGLASIYSANTSTWDPNAIIMLRTLFPLLAVIAIVLITVGVIFRYR